jgi:murein tripeptide amidase MpaA
MHWTARWVAAIAAAMLAATAGAQAPARYDDHVVVRAEIASEKDLDSLRSIGARLFGEAEGIGPVDYLLERRSLAALEASGIRHRVLIEDVQGPIAAERERLAAAGGVAGGPWFLDFKDYAAVNAKLDEFAATRPDLASVFTVGTSLEGRAIRGVRITGPGSGKPAVLINGCQHAREWIAVMVPMYVADQLIGLYDTDPDVAALVNAIEWFIVPIVNPDGYVYTWGPDRLWRKNRRNNGNGTFGVDLNRNWGYEWGHDSGSSSDSGSETYRGPAPFSEPETQAMRDFYQARPQIVSNIDFHSYSQLVLGPWGYTDVEVPADNNLLQPLGDAMAAAILSVHGETYVSGPAGPTLYLASGISIDWAYGDQGVFSYTIELRPTGSPGFILEPQEIIPTAEENFAAVVELGDFSLQGVLFDFPQGLPPIVEADAATALSLTMTPIAAPLVPGSGALRSRVGGAGPYASTPLGPVGGDLYTGTLPAAACGQTIEYYFEVATTSGTYRSPPDAPTSVYEASSFEVEVVFADDFESNLGWTITNQALTDGPWDRGVPIPQGTCDRGNPGADADGSGQCYLTDNSAANMCNSDVDGGTTVLTSPVMDASDPGATITYWRWYDNTGAGQGASPFSDVFVVEVSGDGGGTWVNLETVGPAGPEVVGGWFQRSFLVSASGAGNSSQFRIRFSASDLGQGSVVEAAVDGVVLQSTFCPPVEGCPWDLDGSGAVAINDFLGLLQQWGTAPGGPPDFDGGGVGITDFLELLSHWGPCP